MRSRNLESQTCSFLLILVAHSCMYPRVLRSYSNIEIRERFSLCFTTYRAATLLVSANGLERVI
jgi:hypothetical protein